jgi:type I restriction enzyme S subunit
MGWQSKRLAEVTELITDGSHNPPPAQDEGIPMLSARNISAAGIDLNAGFRLVSEKDFLEEVRRADPQPGDVLLTIVGTIGRTTIVSEHHLPFCLQRSVALLRPKADLHPAYLNYWIQAPRLQKFFALNARGTAQKGVYLKTLKGAPVDYPDPEEQKRICAELDNSLSGVNACVHLLEGVQAKLKQARASILKAAVEGRLAAEGIRTDIECKPYVVKDICISKPCNGKSVPTGVGFPVLRLTAMKDGRLVPTETKLGAWTEESAKPYVVQQGDFFVMRGNGSLSRVGDAAIAMDAGINAAFPDTMIRLQPDPRLCHPAYLLLCWRSPDMRTQIERSAKTTAGIYKINQRDISAYRIGLPDLECQRLILQEVERRFSVLDQVESTVQASLARCALLRQAILKRAFEGRLVPAPPESSDPADHAITSP